MLRRVQGKLAFGTLADSSGRIQLFAPSASTPDFEQFCELNLGDWIGVRGQVMTTRRGELSVRVDSWALLAPTPALVPRQVARHDRSRHPLPPALRRPVGHRGGPPRLPAAVADHVDDPALHGGPRLPRGRDPGPAPHPRRRARQALHHPPQRARPGDVPAHRPGALPEAARRRRLREGLRDRPGVPQRGHLQPAQPRVHDARGLRGVRRLPRAHGADRAAGGPPGHRALRVDHGHLRRP